MAHKILSFEEQSKQKIKSQCLTYQPVWHFFIYIISLGFYYQKLLQRNSLPWAPSSDIVAERKPRQEEPVH